MHDKLSVSSCLIALQKDRISLKMLWNRPKLLYYGVNLVLGTGTETVELHSHAPPLTLRRHTSTPSHLAIYPNGVITHR